MKMNSSAYVTFLEFVKNQVEFLKEEDNDIPDFSEAELIQIAEQVFEEFAGDMDGYITMIVNRRIGHE